MFQSGDFSTPKLCGELQQGALICSIGHILMGLPHLFVDFSRYVLLCNRREVAATDVSCAHGLGLPPQESGTEAAESVPAVKLQSGTRNPHLARESASSRRHSLLHVQKVLPLLLNQNIRAALKMP